MSQTKHTREATFSSYKKDESKQYAQVRMAYHPSVYETAIAHHTATGGHLDSLLDVGCGPGLATRDLAAHFKHVTGIDAGESMIEVARSMNIQPRPPSLSASNSQPRKKWPAYQMQAST
jgi:2-polyprenyl-3-methyl-5-hydroxy-6-metoxy-1,4-benzoquinol methylase